MNGIRAIERKGHWPEILQSGADIICLQETKAEAEQLSASLRTPDGYQATFWSSQERRGYAGTAIYTKLDPVEVRTGFPAPWEHLDKQGRIIIHIYSNWVLVNCYFPNGGGGADKLAYKLEFYDAFLEYMNQLRDEHGQVVIVGDFNVAHEAIDLARPKENEKNTGFLPEERAWFDELIAAGWVDTWRTANPSRAEAYTYWDTKTRARDRNVGWRIDYAVVSASLAGKVAGVQHLVDQLGSDHCPVLLQLDI